MHDAWITIIKLTRRIHFIPEEKLQNKKRIHGNKAGVSGEQR